MWTISNPKNGSVANVTRVFYLQRAIKSGVGVLPGNLTDRASLRFVVELRTCVRILIDEPKLALDGGHDAHAPIWF